VNKKLENETKTRVYYFFTFFWGKMGKKYEKIEKTQKKIE